MTRTIISIPENEKRWLDAYGKRHRISSAEVVRLAVREFRQRKPAGGLGDVKAIREDPATYGSPLLLDITDTAEIRRRAVAAAGRFTSGVSDLSVEHDRYLAEELGKDKSKPENGEEATGRGKKGGGTR